MHRDNCIQLVSIAWPLFSWTCMTYGTLADKQTFAALDIVGWYTTASQIDAADMLLHRKVSSSLIMSSTSILGGLACGNCWKVTTSHGRRS